MIKNRLLLISMLFVIMLLMLNGCKKAAEKQAQTLIGQESGIAQGQQDVPPEGGAEPGVVEDVPPPEEAPIPTEGVIIADVPPPEEPSAGAEAGEQPAAVEDVPPPE